MTSRRQFITSAAAATASVLAAPPVSSAGRPTPLRAEPRARQLFLEYRPIGEHDCAYDVFTDAPLHPRPIIRREVVDEVFGPDIYDTLDQPDHWRMIDEGWFGGPDLDDLDKPERSFDPLVLQWHAWHKPTSEAYWLVRELFPDAQPECSFGSLDPYDVFFCIHPCTPLVAEVSLRNFWRIDEFAAEIAARSRWLRLDPVPRNTGES